MTKCSRTFYQVQLRKFQIVSTRVGLGGLQSELVVKDFLRAQQVDSGGFFIELEGIELGDSVENPHNIAVFFELVFLDEGDKHADHGISIETA